MDILPAVAEPGHGAEQEARLVEMVVYLGHRRLIALLSNDLLPLLATPFGGKPRFLLIVQTLAKGVQLEFARGDAQVDLTHRQVVIVRIDNVVRRNKGQQGD